MATYEELMQSAEQIRTNELPESNTHELVGQHLKNQVEHFNKEGNGIKSLIEANKKEVDGKLTELEKHVVYNINKDNDDTNYTLQEALNKIPSEFKTICRAIIYKDSERDGKTSIAVFDSNAYSSGFTTPENWSVFNYSDVESIINQLNIKLSQGDLFYMDNGVNKDGTENSTVMGTPYILIDKNYDVSVKASEAGSTYSPLNWYDKDLIFISNAAQGSAGVKEFTIQKADIPENAVYMRSSKASGHNNLYVKNGDISYDRLTKWISVRLAQIQKKIEEGGGGGDTPTIEGVLYEGDLFFTSSGVNKDGTINYSVMGTPFILIDKNSDLEVKASEAGSTWSPLNFYDDKFAFISNKATGTSGTKIIKVAKSEYPTNAKYIKCSRASASVTGLYVKNGQMSYGRLVEAEEKTKAEQAVTISNLDERVTALENPVDNPEEKAERIKKMAEKYDAIIAKREMYLRQKYQYDKVGRWYGVTWNEEDNPDNVTDIYAEGCEELCNTLPIQNKMRRCVVKDGVLQYYLDANNSELKADGGQAKLDGTDGNVMVEIPEFFYKFEVSESDGVKTVKLMISEDGIDGFNYSPKHYVGAYYATLNRDTNILATVCSAKFTREEKELRIKDVDTYEEVQADGYSLGVQKMALRSGFESNAATYRGGNQSPTAKVRDPKTLTEVSSDYWDNANDASQDTFCLNKLGVAVAQVNRSECRGQSRMWIGETMYLYDTQKALWILSSVEFKTRNIQKPINSENPREGGLGWGATVYPNYEAYEAYFAYRGTACIPNGVTNNLGNKSGEVYYRMPKVPVEFSGSLADPSFDRYADVLIPVMSYRGVENYYGHMYATADQIAIKCIYLEGENRRVDYYYQRNPFRCKTDISEYEHLGQFEFEATIKSISGILMGFDGHILPIKSTTSYDNGYCDCTEIGHTTPEGNYAGVSFNGRLASKTLVGRNFVVSFWRDDERANRGSESVRQCQFIL